MNRLGTCNRCGQCCGANGSQPWPKEWYPESGEPSWRNWLQPKYYELLALVGVIQLPDGTWGPNPAKLYGGIKILGTTYYYIWVLGHGLMKDTSAKHDGTSWSVECPFLEGDPEDAERGCGLDSPQYVEFRTGLCELMGHTSLSAEDVAEWQAAHPLCSYTWA